MSNKVGLVSALVGFCILGGMVVGGVKLSVKSHAMMETPYSAGVILPPVVIAEQGTVLAASQQYTNLWVAGRYDQMYFFVSPYALAYDVGRQDSFTRRLQKQRMGLTDSVPPTAKPEAMHLISIPRQGLEVFFEVALNARSLRKFLKNKGPDGSQKNIAVVEFFLQHHRYRQVWEREPSGQWFCLNLPLAMDDATSNAISFDDFNYWKHSDDLNSRSMTGNY